MSFDTDQRNLQFVEAQTSVPTRKSRRGGNVFSNIYVNKCNGHIATAFLIISEVPAHEGSEFIITVQKDTRNNTDAEAYCNVIE